MVDFALEYVFMLHKRVFYRLNVSFTGFGCVIHWVPGCKLKGASIYIWVKMLLRTSPGQFQGWAFFPPKLSQTPKLQDNPAETKLKFYELLPLITYNMCDVFYDRLS